MIQTNQITNCPVTAQDFKVAAHMLGPNISTLKGKNTWQRPIPVIQETVELPPELSFCKNVALALDIVRANQTPFLTTISLKLQCRACERVIPKGAKEDSFFATADKALRRCNKGRFQVTEIRADTEFKTLLEPLEDEHSIASNLAKEHVPEIEHSNRVVKERV